MGLISSVLTFSQLLVVYEKVRVAPDTWYNVVNCADNFLLVSFHVPVYEKDTQGRSRILWILCDTLARCVVDVSRDGDTCEKVAWKTRSASVLWRRCRRYWTLALRWPTHTQINGRVCRSSDDGCFPEMTRRATMPCQSGRIYTRERATRLGKQKILPTYFLRRIVR